MHALHILPGGEYGGAEAQIIALAKGLRERGVDVTIIAFYDASFAKRCQEEGIAITVIESRSLREDRARVAAYLREHPADLLHTHGVRASVLGRSLGKALSLPVVTTIHSDLAFDYHGLRKVLMMQMERFTRKRSRKVIAVSEALRKTLLLRGYPQEQVVTIANGIDDKKAQAAIAHAHATPLALHQELGINPSSYLVLNVARLHPVKYQQDLISAIGSLPIVQEKEVHLLIAGDGEQKAMLEQLAQDVAPGRVHFLGARDDIYALLHVADLFALTSHMEGLPITLLEAMVAGVPIVATHVGGMVELVHGDGSDQDRCGITVAAHDTKAIAAAIKSLLTQDEQRVTMGDNGRRRVAQAYTQSIMARRVHELYQEIVMKPSGL